MQRGEVWRYALDTSPRSRLMVLVSSDGINDSARPWLLGAEVVDDDPQDILAVQLDGHGWVHAGIVSRLYRPGLQERVDELAVDVRERVDTALRAALDL